MMELAFAGLHQLRAPMLDRLEAVERQRREAPARAEYPELMTAASWRRGCSYGGRWSA
jgi:hypothetical protein